MSTMTAEDRHDSGHDARPPGSRCADAHRRRNEGVDPRDPARGAVVSILISVGIVLSLVFEAISSCRRSAVQLFADGWFPRRGMFSIPTVLAGTLIITRRSRSLIAAPIGLASAIYLSEYASPRVREHRQADPRDPGRHPERRPRLLRADAGSARTSSRRSSPTPRRFNLLAAGIGVGILTIPLVASISEDAMRAVPVASARRPTASARGGSRPVLRVVVPAAISGHRRGDDPGHLAGDRRDDGRRARRGRDRGLAVHPRTRSGPGQTLTGAMASLATGSDQVTGNTAAFQSLFFLGLLLFLMTLGLNVLGDASSAARGRRTRRASMTAPSIAHRASGRSVRRQGVDVAGLAVRRRCCSWQPALLAGDPRRPGRHAARRGAPGLRRARASTS